MLGFALMLVVAFWFPGIILQTKAKMCGRKGAGFLQPWKDVWKLLRKGSVYSRTTTFVFQIAPTLYFSTVVCCMLLLPFGGGDGIFSFSGDIVFFAYLLGLGRFFMIIAALDTGSSFEGMGANREAFYGLLVEPAFFILLGSFAMFTGHTSFQGIYDHFAVNDYSAILVGILGTYLLIQITMIENSRMPVDDPTTHLELTMIHEVMVLDNSGFDLGLIQATSALKFALFGTLISNIFFDQSYPLWLNIVLFLSLQLAFAIVVGLLESFKARNKMSKNPQFILTLSSISILIFFAVLVLMTK